MGVKGFGKLTVYKKNLLHKTIEYRNTIWNKRLPYMEFRNLNVIFIELEI